MTEATFLDFDGVVVDSIDECYKISKESFFGFCKCPINEEEYKSLFYKNRYLVRPLHEYMNLHQTLLKYFEKTITESEIQKTFIDFQKLTTQKTQDRFEYTFLKIREYHRQDLDKWLSMHNLTNFGKTLQSRELNDHFVITTKDKKSVQLLCNHFDIKLKIIFDKDDYRMNGSKGNIIRLFLNKSLYDKAIFVDDSIEHLQSINDPRVDVYFANWAYDKNSNGFKVYKY